MSEGNAAVIDRPLPTPNGDKPAVTLLYPEREGMFTAGFLPFDPFDCAQGKQAQTFSLLNTQ